MAKTPNAKTEAGTDHPQAATEAFSIISTEKLLGIYTAMVKCRMLEQRATTLFQQGKLKSDLHPSAGREASAAAVCVDLETEDTLCIAPGDWLPAFVKGMSLEAVFRALAPADSQPDGRTALETAQKNILLPLNQAPPIETIRERAEGACQNKGTIVVVFIAPGADSLNVWKKTMAMAAARRLPFVFVQYIDRLPEPAAARAKSGSKNPEAVLEGLPAIAVDALDPVALYRVACEAIVRARQARGSTLLQCTVLPPYLATELSEQNHEASDPLTAMENYLKRKAIEPGPHNRLIVDSFTSDLDLATRFAGR